MIRAYLFALDPTDAQVEGFRSHCGAQRVAYNWALARVLANWAQRAAEQTYGLSGDQLTGWINTSAYSLRKMWNDAKHEVAPWWAENSKEAYASGCANLAAALENRKAGRIRMPRFKSRHRARLSCRFSTGAFGLASDRRHIRLPVIVVRTAESTRKLARKVEAGTARIRSATLSHQRGRWQVSFSVEVDDAEPAPRDGGRVLGVDLGITIWRCCPPGSASPTTGVWTGPCVTCAEPSASAPAVVARTAGHAPSRRTGGARRGLAPTASTPGWRTCDANDTHQLTTRLVHEFDTIAVEDLHVAGMLRNRRLARHIAGAGWAEIRRQLTYKTQRAGARLVVADRWFASSKTCSGCGTAKAKLALSARTYVCTTCGLVLDRDLNAALNLAALAAATGELRRELPTGSDVRPIVLARPAVAPPREESTRTQRHHREAVAR